jgi:hypothetical protein
MLKIMKKKSWVQAKLYLMKFGIVIYFFNFVMKHEWQSSIK